MKKTIVTLALALFGIGAMAGTPVIPENKERVTEKVLQAFRDEFSRATEVEWTAADNYYRAAFVYNDRHVFAYYNPDGELIGLSRYISPADLPARLQSNLWKSYPDYWISDLFEVVRDTGNAYFLTIENADTKIILRSVGLNWTVYQKIKKA
ncbi:MAG TPA: hypothetical protein VEB63_04915 [Chitinophagaceae bacterium]|nr:hypothetical protein [Chitinophagaceae bacterium]